MNSSTQAGGTTGATNDKIDAPIVGDKIYIPSALHVSHGEDDIQGGLATVTDVEFHGSQNHKAFVTTNVGSTAYNWQFLREKQDALKAEFGDALAKETPDYRSEFNKWD